MTDIHCFLCKSPFQFDPAISIIENEKRLKINKMLLTDGKTGKEYLGLCCDGCFRSLTNLKDNSVIREHGKTHYAYLPNSFRKAIIIRLG